MGKHHKYGPSTLVAKSKCIRFDYNDSDPTAGDEGTELHSAYESGNLAGLNDEQKSAVTAARDFTGSLKAEHGGPECWAEFKEEKVTLPDLTWGTADNILVHKSKPLVIVTDAKFIRTVNEYDLQLKAYGAAVVDMLGDSDCKLFADIPWAFVPEQLEKLEVRLIVLAPRLQEIEIETHNGPELLESTRAIIEDLYSRIENPFNPPTPNEDICSKCKWAHACPAFGEAAVQTARGIGLPVPQAFDPAMMVNDQDRCIAQVLAGALENWAKLVKRYNTEFVSNGGAIPGYRLVDRSTGIKVPKEFTASALDALEMDLQIPRHVLLEHTSITLGELTKRWAQETGDLEALVKENIKSTLEDLLTEDRCQYLTKVKRSTTDQQLLQQ